MALCDQGHSYNTQPKSPHVTYGFFDVHSACRIALDLLSCFVSPTFITSHCPPAPPSFPLSFCFSFSFSFSCFGEHVDRRTRSGFKSTEHRAFRLGVGFGLGPVLDPVFSDGKQHINIFLKRVCILTKKSWLALYG